MSKSCECTTSCGDDPNVQARIVLGCDKFRARRNPAALGEANSKLRKSLRNLVHLMNRMEPDVAEAVREQAEKDWDGLKAEAMRVLEETA